MVKISKEAALQYHESGRPGKIEVKPTKAYRTQTDLSLAYSPGVAYPCLEIQENPDDAYRYTDKGNLVAVISNGTAVLGLGDIGAMSGKPVMEGKGLLFKIYGGIDVFDIEVDEKDPEKFCEAVERIAPTFGGINLEDIKAPECFYIEERLKRTLDIPVMHDDQHGTAIISAAGLKNAMEVIGKDISKVKIVVNGAGAAAISCTKLYMAIGAQKENIVMLDSKGVISTERQDLNEQKRFFATEPHRHPHAGRGRQRCRRLRGTVEGQRADEGDGEDDGQRPRHLRTGQPRAGNQLRGRHGGPSRRADVDRPHRLSQPDQQRHRLPLHLPRCPRRARHRHQRGDEAGRRARHCRPGQAARARRGERRLQGEQPAPSAATTSFRSPSTRDSSPR